MPAWLTTVLDLLGAALIVAGIAMVFVPAAFAVAGAACLAISWRASRR
ncbi:hypothetical protein [Pseudarthrobacter sp. ATCC 49987]|nr:hypothetical protein [Pseudarthrobacter sp. ATCC 49987]